MTQANVIIHEIATDGLPDMDALTGRVAFIFDGCIVSGWPLGPDDDDDEDELWEANSDVGHNRPFGGVTHWVEFPTEIWNLAAPTSPLEPVPSTPRVFAMPPEPGPEVTHVRDVYGQGFTRCDAHDGENPPEPCWIGDTFLDDLVIPDLMLTWKTLMTLHAPLTEVEETNGGD